MVRQVLIHLENARLTERLRTEVARHQVAASRAFSALGRCNVSTPSPY